MKTFTENLIAGKRTRLPCNGHFFNLFSSSAPIDIKFIAAGKGSTGDVCEDILSGFWYESPNMLTFVEMTSQVNQAVQWSVSHGRAGYTRVSGEVTAISPQANFIGCLSVALETNDKTLVFEANSQVKNMIFTADPENTGTIYLGGDNVDENNAAIILEAGESYETGNCCAASWYAYSNADYQKVRVNIGVKL